MIEWADGRDFPEASLQLSRSIKTIMLLHMLRADGNLIYLILLGVRGAYKQNMALKLCSRDILEASHRRNGFKDRNRKGLHACEGRLEEELIKGASDMHRVGGILKTRISCGLFPLH